jgi:hypothetical protein
MLWTRLALPFHSELLLFEADLNSLLRWVCTGVAQRVGAATLIGVFLVLVLFVVVERLGKKKEVAQIPEAAAAEGAGD